MKQQTNMDFWLENLL